MTHIKEIDIAEPIWKTRSVGLAVDDVPLGQMVRITISYIKKDGKALYPAPYLMLVDHIRKYPRQKVRGNVFVHVVPIESLAKSTVFTNNKNKQPMLFDQKSLQGIIDKSEEQKNQSFDNKKLIEPGKHKMTMIDIQLTKAKDQNPMIVAEFSLDDDHRTVKDFYKLSGHNTDIPREKLVKLFHRGFGYAIKPCQTEKDLIDQLVKFKGKQLTVAIKGKKTAYSFEKDGKPIVMESMFPEFWYCGSAEEFDEFHIDMAKAMTELSPEDKQKLVAFAELNGGPYVPTAKTEATAEAVAPVAETVAPVETAPVATAPAAEVAQPIENVAAEAPKVEAAPVEQAPAATTPEPKAETPPPATDAAPAAEGGDDFPF